MKINKRYQQKLKTHQNLMFAALSLMSEEKGLGELSLREVAGEAGIVPAAFYRHFKSMEELGLALVDDSAEKIASILKDARKKGAYRSALHSSIGYFFDYVSKNRSLFRFISRERNGGYKKIREKIRTAMETIASELALDMRMPKSISFADTLFASQMIVGVAFQRASEFLDLDGKDHQDIRKLKFLTVKQLRLVFVGTIRGRKRIRTKIKV
ncbi:TetR family transcriptional regulator [Leptospira sp. 96542]|nr:TetR family transcriptional regulator [Leptospira sp. 96542]